MPAISKLKIIETREGRPIVDVLCTLYERYGSQTAVAVALGVSQATISQWLQRLGLAEKTILVPKSDGKSYNSSGGNGLDDSDSTHEQGLPLLAVFNERKGVKS